jgi:hypothetical protein
MERTHLHHDAGHETHQMSNTLTRQAIAATVHCLTGCAIGEVLGMVLTTAFGWSNAVSIVVSIVLAFVFGYSLSMRPVLAAGLGLSVAWGVALAADTVSITVMEAMDNLTMMTIPGAMDATLGDVEFWAMMVAGLAVAFVITVPVNRAMIARGKGHAVAHQYHH